MPDVLELLRQFGTEEIKLDALDEVSAGDLYDNSEGILADDAAKLGLGAALCARREKRDGDCEDFIVEGASYPFFDGCSSNNDVDWWTATGVPAIGAYLKSLEEAAQELVLQTVGKLVVNRLWLDTEPDGMTSEETATWIAIGLDVDALKTAAQAIKDEAVSTEEEPDGVGDEGDPKGDDPEEEPAGVL